MNLAKVKRITVSVELLLEFVRLGPEGRSVRCISDCIPPDAEIVSISMPLVRTVELVVWSEEFPELDCGSQIPVMVPTFVMRTSE